MAHDERFRKCVIAYMNQGHTWEETHETFGISFSTISDWKKLYKETGSFKKRELNRSFKKIDPEKLKTYVEEHPDAYLKEMAQEFQCAKSAIDKALKRLKITRKKN